MTASPQACVGAVVVDGDRLLLVQRRNEPGAGRWSIPGGRVEPGETLAEAVVRELAEEVGLDAVCGPFIGWSESIGEHGHHVILDFAATVVDPSQLTAGDDASAAAWVHVSEVAGHDLVDGLAGFLSDHRITPAVA